jgi:hypothetical protein
VVFARSIGSRGRGISRDIANRAAHEMFATARDDAVRDIFRIDVASRGPEFFVVFEMKTTEIKRPLSTPG